MPKKSSSPPRFAELSNQLDELLIKLQSEDIDIDAALELHQAGTKLIAQMQKRLTEVEVKVTELKLQ